MVAYFYREAATVPFSSVSWGLAVLGFDEAVCGSFFSGCHIVVAVCFKKGDLVFHVQYT